MNNTQFSGDKIPKGYRTAQLQQYTPEQMQLLQQGLNNVGPDSYLSKLAGGDQSFFNEMEAPAKRQFNDLIGGLSSRFSGAGMGGRRSGAFQNATSAAASNFSQDLASKRMDLRRQAVLDLHGMSQQLLGNRPYERSLVEKEKPWWQQAATGFASGAGQGVGNAVGQSFGDFFKGSPIPAGG